MRRAEAPLRAWSRIGFDDLTNNEVVDVVGGNNRTYTGSSSPVAATGVSGGAIDLDSNDDVIVLGDPVALRALTTTFTFTSGSCRSRQRDRTLRALVSGVAADTVDGAAGAVSVLKL